MADAFQKTEDYYASFRRKEITWDEELFDSMVRKAASDSTSLNESEIEIILETAEVLGEETAMHFVHAVENICNMLNKLKYAGR
jgi:hypothetical protein